MSGSDGIRSCPIVIDPLGRDIHGEISRIRQRGPATQVELPGGVRVWSVTGYDDIRQLLVDPRVSKDAYQHWTAWRSGAVGPEWPLAIWVSVQNMVTAYGAEHTRLRKPVATAFTARRVDALRPRVQEITDRLLDRLAAHGPTEPVDLREAFAHPLPMKVMSELFGIPVEWHDTLHRIIKAFFSTTIEKDEALANVELLYATMAELVCHKRRTPGNDLTSGLIAVRTEDGSRLGEKELVDNLILLYTAGYETTVNLLDNAVTALLTHPAQLALLRDGGADWSDAVEESLRLDAPGAHSLLRYAVEDIRIGDTVIPRGEAIMVSFAAAGRDPRQHGATGNTFDVGRPTGHGHIAFGHGTHHCLGAQLARMEAEIGLRSLFTRFPELALAVGADELVHQASFISNGHRDLPVLTGAQ
ncbi:cytochrome P450 family protein [Streptomyces alanosinicus]|uniref:Cytochrome P450 n=1 Tax=Streptomyces alanosinicus TaxID=68171 RepID=A0A918YSW6_9ACTN|nr:cytochrome P450 [Streptomyces alanosinicus]GHE15607.1 cytochrome P450 [Streptomyces alanosinicus]